MQFLKNNFSNILLILTILGLIGYFYFILTPKIDMAAETQKKIDSLNQTIHLIEVEQKKLDSQIVNYNSEVEKMDKNISKIKNEKTIIREIYHEKINSVNNFNTNQLDSFFSNRYNK